MKHGRYLVFYIPSEISPSGGLDDVISSSDDLTEAINNISFLCPGPVSIWDRIEDKIVYETPINQRKISLRDILP